MTQGAARPLRASALKNKPAESDISDVELDDQRKQDEIRYPKPKTLKLHSGDIELHRLGSRAQRSFTGFAIRLTTHARSMGQALFGQRVCALLVAPDYFAEFLLYIVAAMHPANNPTIQKQFEELVAEQEKRFEGPMAAADLGTIFAYMTDLYEIAKVIENLPKM